MYGKSRPALEGGATVGRERKNGNLAEAGGPDKPCQKGRSDDETLSLVIFIR